MVRLPCAGLAGENRSGWRWRRRTDARVRQPTCLGWRQIPRGDREEHDGSSPNFPYTLTFPSASPMLRFISAVLAVLVALPAVAQPASPLSSSDVREYVRLRLVQHEVLTRAEAELGPLDNDENGPVARERLLARFAAEGADYERFQSVEERIFDAVSLMEEEAAMAETRAEMEAALAEASAYMTEAQLAEARAGLAGTDAEMQTVMDASRPDWPAVRPHLALLEHLDAYTAGNRPDPPVLD